MGIAAETVDDRLVLERELVIVLQTVALEEIYGDLLHDARLAVHEGHVEELAFGLRQLLIGAEDHGFLREHQRDRILGEGARRVAVDVPGKLIENENFSEAPVRLLAPVPQLTS